jgi:hypothetical protein
MQGEKEAREKEANESDSDESDAVSVEETPGESEVSKGAANHPKIKVRTVSGW